MTGIASINPRKATYCTNTPSIVSPGNTSPPELPLPNPKPNPSAMRNPWPPKNPNPVGNQTLNETRSRPMAETREDLKGCPRRRRIDQLRKGGELGNGKRNGREATWHRWRFCCCAAPHDDASAVRHDEELPCCCKAQYLQEPTARGDHHPQGEKIKKKSPKRGKENPRVRKRDAPSDRGGGGDRRGGLRTRCPCRRRGGRRGR